MQLRGFGRVGLPGHCEELPKQRRGNPFSLCRRFRFSTAFAGLLGSKASHVVEKSVNSVSAFGAKSSVHSLSPPLPIEPANAGLRRGPQLGELLAYTRKSLPCKGEMSAAPTEGFTPPLTTAKTGASVSASSGSSLFFGSPYFFSKSRPRYRNVTACARVHFPVGSKIAALLPLVMPFSTAHSTA